MRQAVRERESRPGPTENVVAFAANLSVFSVFFFTALYLQLISNFTGNQIALVFTSLAVTMIASGLVQFAVAEATVEEIDRINILQATFLAMRRALQALAEQPEVVLIDGNQVPPRLGCRAETIVGGDARSYSIAAASIFAKVTRDRYMARLAESFPGYGWETNRGYGSEEHLVALQCLGPTPHHRMSFSPLNRLL